MNAEEEIQRLRVANRTIYNALKNYHVLIDTPIGRRALNSDIATEAREIARQVIDAVEKEDLLPNPSEAYGVRYGFSEEHADYPREDWEYEVANGDTVAGYHDWVLGRIHAEFEPSEEASPGPGA